MKDKGGRTITVSLQGRLRALAHPITGECLSDFERLNGFVRASNNAADALDAAAYYIDRLESMIGGKAVRDMTEAQSAWLSAIKIGAEKESNER